MAYTAVISKLENVRKHSNADRLNVATCLGYQVIVGLDAKEGDVVVLFPDDGQISEAFAKANNLVGYTENGERKGGYFDSSRRVRAQKFRGEKSEAFVIGLKSLEFTGYDLKKLEVGTKFVELGGISICNKYVTEATLKAAAANKPKTPKLNETLKRMFPEHTETDQLRHARPDELMGLVTLTAKLHGTSGRSAKLKVKEERPLKWHEELYFALADAFFGPEKHIFNFFLSDLKKEQIRERPSTEVWKSVYGTRRVIKGEVRGEVNEVDKDFREKCHQRLAPHIKQNEVWYYEIVGFEDSGRPIMSTVDCSKMGKDFVKRFGKTMTYKYGCLPAECEIYVYRIALMSEDGGMLEMPWGVVKERCRKAGVKHVPEIGAIHIPVASHTEFLKREVEHETEGRDIADPIDPSHIREGVCVRVQNLETGAMKIFKEKLFAFKCLEGIIKDSGVVDTEEVEAEGA